MRNDFNGESEKASDLISLICEFDSNEIEERNLQLEKHHPSRILTLFGITIELSDEHVNAMELIRANCEFGSDNFDFTGNYKIQSFGKTSNEFVIDNINQRIIIKNQAFVSRFN
jgi:hypothetical protein